MFFHFQDGQPEDIWNHLLEEAIDEKKYDIAVSLLMRGGRLNDVNPFDQLINLAKEVDMLDENVVKVLESRGTNNVEKVEFKRLLNILNLASKSDDSETTKNIMSFIKENDLSYRDQEKNTPLHIGVTMNSFHIIKASIERVNVNAINQDGNTPLHLTKDSEDIEIAKFLLENGAVLEATNTNEDTPLHLATMSNNFGIVRLLIENGGDVEATNKGGKTPLTLAIEMNYFEIFDLLVANKANIMSKNQDGNTPLHLVTMTNNFQMAHILIRNGADPNALNNDGSNPLHFAKNLTSRKVPMYLISKGANVYHKNHQGYTPLNLALKKKNLEIAKTFLGNALFKKTENIRNFENLPFNEADYDGGSLLHQAVEENDFVTVEFLLENSANKEAKNTAGNTPLHCAIKNENFDTTSILIDSGANLNVQDQNGNTPLHLAVLCKHGMIMQYILENGANLTQFIENEKTVRQNYLEGRNENFHEFFGFAKLDAKNFDGNTPLHLAVLNDHHGQKVKFLIEHGATTTQFIKNNRGQMPLDIAKQKDEEIFRIILIDFLNNVLRHRLSSAQYKDLLGSGNDLFCLKRDFDGSTTILQFIVDLGMIKERETMLQLLIKMDSTKYPKSSSGESKSRIIKILRKGIQASKGLKDTIDSLQEKFPWSGGKVALKTFVSISKNVLFGGFMYAFDIWTDVQFSLELRELEEKTRNSTPENNSTQNFLFCRAKKIQLVSTMVSNCIDLGIDTEECVNEFDLASNVSNSMFCDVDTTRFHDPVGPFSAYVVSVFHIVLPFLFSFIVFFNLINFSKIDWYTPLKFPLPILTKTHKTIIEVKSHFNNQKKKGSEGFESRKRALIKEAEEQKMMTHISMILEASLESSFQFLYQGLFSMPTLMLAIMDVSGANELKDLVSWKILSIISSFFTFAWTSFNLR